MLPNLGMGSFNGRLRQKTNAIFEKKNLAGHPRIKPLLVYFYFGVLDVLASMRYTP